MIITRTLWLGILLLVGSAFAEDRRVAQSADEVAHFAWADVLRVDPVYDYVPVNNPREECYEEQIEQQHDDADSKAGGTLLGAIIGGVFGNTFGKGDGRKAATAAGAVAGAVVGNKIAKDADNTYITERHCRQVNASDEQRRIIAYDVEYRYRGEVYISRLNYDPGDRLRVRVSVIPAE